MPDQNTDKYFLSAIVKSSQDSIITVDFDMTVTSWNKGAERIYGYSAKEAIGKPLMEITLPVDLQMLTKGVRDARKSKRVKLFDNVRVKKGGKEIWVEISLSPVKDSKGKVIGVSTLTRDVTERKIAEEALLKHDALLQKVLTLQEDERARLSREMHDELGQEVTALRFMLKSTKAKARVAGIARNIEEMEHIIKNIDRSLDFLSWNLRPAAFDVDSSLTAAMNNFTKQWSRHTGIPVEHIPPLRGEHFVFAVYTNLYRIMQEALNNVHKHAGATQVEVSLKRRDGTLVFIISDNGKGFNLNYRKTRKGFGLIGMRERAALIGAKFEIESSRGKGTTIYITVPLGHATAA